MNQEDSGAKIVFKLAGMVAIIALVLSISRLFLSSSDKSSIQFFWNYNLAIPSQMTAFLSVLGVSVVFILIGVMVNKHYDFIGFPMIAGSMITLILITALAYITKALYVGFSDASADATSDLVLTVTIGIEWLMLIIYTWFAYAPSSQPVTTDHQSANNNINQNNNQPNPGSNTNNNINDDENI